MSEQAPLFPVGIKRRDFLKFAGAAMTLLVSPVGQAATSILAVRVWPARDYTRVTLEHDQAIKYSHLLVKDPERLVEINTLYEARFAQLSERVAA